METQRRPRTRGECAEGPRPCPWVSCRHHLALDVSEKSGHVKVNIDPERLGEAPYTCALDVADLGPHSEAEVSEILGGRVTRQGIADTGRRAIAHAGRVTRRTGRHLRVVA